MSAGRDRAAERPSPLARECVQWPMRVLTRPVRTPGLTVIMNSGDSASRTQCQFATHTKGGTAQQRVSALLVMFSHDLSVVQACTAYCNSFQSLIRVEFMKIITHE